MKIEQCIETLKELWRYKESDKYSEKKIREALDLAIKALEQQPHKGKWVHWTDDYKDYVTCSECEYGAEGEVFLSDKTPFCPICGADMRESDSE